MKKIENKGNLPPHIQIFCKVLQGRLAGMPDTEFWEASSIAEFEKQAVEIGYEIVPTIDKSTDRAYLVGFDVSEPSIIAITAYYQMKMYFIEITPEQLRKWEKRMKQDRIDQQIDMRNRQEINKKKGKKRIVKLEEKK